MSDEIKPALTSEQWATKRVRFAVDAEARLFADGVQVYLEECQESLAETISGKERHAVAALLLHDQPFGFTHHHVQMLRMQAEVFHGCNIVPKDGEEDAADFVAMWFASMSKQYSGLADIIEALLPPPSNDVASLLPPP